MKVIDITPFLKKKEPKRLNPFQKIDTLIKEIKQIVVDLTYT